MCPKHFFLLAGRQSFSIFVSGMAWKVYYNIFKIYVDETYKLMYYQTCVKPTKTDPIWPNKCLGHITLKQQEHGHLDYSHKALNQDLIKELVQYIVVIDILRYFCYADNSMLSSLILSGIHHMVRIINKYIAVHGLQLI
jgi:hypothetical protein